MLNVASAIAKSMFGRLTGGLFRRAEDVVVDLNATGVTAEGFAAKCADAAARVVAFRAFFKTLQDLALDYVKEVNSLNKYFDSLNATYSNASGVSVQFNTTILDTPSTDNETSVLNSVNSSLLNLSVDALLASQAFQDSTKYSLDVLQAVRDSYQERLELTDAWAFINWRLDLDAQLANTTNTTNSSACAGFTDCVLRHTLALQGIFNDTVLPAMYADQVNQG